MGDTDVVEIKRPFPHVTNIQIYAEARKTYLLKYNNTDIEQGKSALSTSFSFAIDDEDVTALIEAILKHLEDQDQLNCSKTGLGYGRQNTFHTATLIWGLNHSKTLSAYSSRPHQQLHIGLLAKSWSSIQHSRISKCLLNSNSHSQKVELTRRRKNPSGSELQFFDPRSNSRHGDCGSVESFSIIKSDLQQHHHPLKQHHQTETRTCQFLLLALDYLCYLAYAKIPCWKIGWDQENEWKVKYLLNPPKQVIAYDYYCSQPVPCLVDSWYKSKQTHIHTQFNNPVYFELLPLRRLQPKLRKRALYEIFNHPHKKSWAARVKSKFTLCNPNAHTDRDLHFGLLSTISHKQQQQQPTCWRNWKIQHSMKALCNCWKKSDVCVACYMENLEDWSNIHAIAMSAEAQRRLEEDLRFLESINVWHLVNLRSNPHSLYSYGERLDALSPSQMRAFPHNPYLHPTYLQGNQYTSGGGNHNGQISPLSVSSALPYPDLILHASEVSSDNFYLSPKPSETTVNLTNNGRQMVELASPNQILPYKSLPSSPADTPPPSPSVSELKRFRNLQILPKEPHDYDVDEDSNRVSPDGKKSVKFSTDTVFIERDMNSPFWRAFTERRRLRRIMRQRKQLNAQIASASYQPSIIEIVKSAFRSRDNNGNETKTKSKGGVLVYDNSNQIPEIFTAQYIYTTPRRSKLFRLLTCQCCSAPSAC